MSDLCVNHGEDDAPRALPSLRLCAGCRARLRKDIHDLGNLHNDLETVLAHGSSPRYGNRVSGSSSEPLPINPAVADHRDQIRHDLAWWVRYVAEERGLAGLPDNRVSEIAAWLGTHVDWIAAHPVAAVECPPVMRGLVGRARALVAPSGARRIAIGPCRGVVDDQACGGTLYATVRAEDDTRESEIYCDGTCGLSMEPSQWRRFGREYLRPQAS
ncbi:hypothetical protein [Actinomadura sp. SCN-SB]|uniref:hypothetical protein n=1 Tax=Actinomadura sp. SCN-SB TaxID=3373092 RepID=UPI0037532AF1